MANKKILIGGEELDTPYNLRTTNFILSTFMSHASDKGTSASLLMNKALFSAANKIKSRKGKTKP
jgi:hypothetical protein